MAIIICMMMKIFLSEIHAAQIMNALIGLAIIAAGIGVVIGAAILGVAWLGL